MAAVSGEVSGCVFIIDPAYSPLVSFVANRGGVYVVSFNVAVEHEIQPSSPCQGDGNDQQNDHDEAHI